MTKSKGKKMRKIYPAEAGSKITCLQCYSGRRELGSDSQACIDCACLQCYSARRELGSDSQACIDCACLKFYSARRELLIKR